MTGPSDPNSPQNQHGPQQNPYGPQQGGQFPQGGYPPSGGYPQQSGGQPWYQPAAGSGWQQPGYGPPIPPRRNKNVIIGVLAGVVVVAALVAFAVLIGTGKIVGGDDDSAAADTSTTRAGSSRTTTSADAESTTRLERTTTSRRTTTPRTTTSSPSPTPTTLSDVDASNEAIRRAQVGTCLHKEEYGEPDPDGSYSVTVRTADCGTEYSTHRVVEVTDDVAVCGDNWVRSGDDAPVVLCLADD